MIIGYKKKHLLKNSHRNEIKPNLLRSQSRTILCARLFFLVYLLSTRTLLLQCPHETKILLDSPSTLYSSVHNVTSTWLVFRFQGTRRVCEPSTLARATIFSHAMYLSLTLVHNVIPHVPVTSTMQCSYRL